MNREIVILREAVVKITQLLAGMGLQVTQQGMQAYVTTDPSGKPTRVNIPHIPDNADEKLILAIQGFIDHEVAHILFTDWKIVKTAMKRGKRHHNLQNIVEDTFIERAMGKKFPGSAYNVERLHDFFIEEITKPALERVKGDPMAEFGVLLVVIARAWAGQKRFKDFMDEEGLWEHPVVKAFVERVPEDIIKRFPKIASTKEGWEIAQVLHDIIHPPKPEGEGEGEEEDESESESSSKKKGGKPSSKKSKSKPERGAGEEPKSKPKKADKSEDDEDEESGEGDDESEAEGGEGEDEGSSEDESGAGSDDGEDEEHLDGEEEDEGDADGDDESEDGSGDDADDADGDEGEVGTKGGEGEDDARAASRPRPNPFEGAECPIPETFEDAVAEKIGSESARHARDADYIVFSKDFDKIEKYPVRADYKDDWLNELEGTTRHMVGVMQKDIERMMAARSQTVRVPGFRSGRLHSAGLHRLVANDDRVFRRTQENTSKDTAVGLLIDNSGSMGGGPIEVAMSAGFALSQTLERVGIAHEVLGFTTQGYGYTGCSPRLIQAEERRIGRQFSRTEALYMPIYKDFAERLTPEVKRRFAAAAHSPRHLANNIDGECVENAALRLAKRKESRKVLLVLSDGLPAGYGVPHEQYANLHRAIDNAKKMGIELVGIGIMSKAVKDYYPRYFVLEDLDSLPGTVMGELKRILTA